jgi:hypothetical protein
MKKLFPWVVSAAISAMACSGGQPTPTRESQLPGSDTPESSQPVHATSTPTPCSPGFWKSHEDAFATFCVLVPGWTCEELLTALTCQGSDAFCRRHEATNALNAVSGCTETD